MRILFVDEYFPPVHSGGAEISAREIASEIGRNHEVTVFTPSHGGLVGTEEAEHFQIFRYRNRFNPTGSLLQQKMLFFLEMTKKLSEFVRVFRPDIIHAQNALSTPAVANTAEKHEMVGVAHVRDHRFECFTSRVACLSHRDATICDFARCVENPLYTLAFPYARLITRCIRRSLVKCGRAIAVSNYLKNEVLRNVPIDVRVSYDGADLEKIHRIRPPKDIYGRSYEPDSTIVYAGGFHKFKGIFELLHGFRMALRKLGHISLLIAGDGPCRRDVQELIRLYHMKENVSLLSSLPHESMISAMKASGLAIVPSLLPEAGSRVIIEALACAKPVLASDRGANAEIIGDAGMTFPPTADDIAHAILTLLNDRDKLQELSNLAKERSSAFSLKSTCTQIIQSYEDWLRR